METTGKKVLVVDNDPFFLKLLGDLLGGEGHRVLCAADAFQCLEVLKDQTPDVIFLDLIMPFLGGDDLCKLIRRQPQFHSTFIVIVSAVALEQPISIYELGADACIAKGPIAGMREHVREVMIEAEHHPGKCFLQQTRHEPTIYPREITRELLAQFDHVRSILDAISQGVFEIAQNRLLYFNASGAEMLGTSLEGVAGVEVSEALPVALLDVLNEQEPEDSLISGGRLRRQVQFNERQFFVEKLTLSKSHRETLLLLTDITERKRMESVIEAANLTENLGYVFSGIRHEIGNPVNSIKMALSVLQRNLGEYDKATIADFLDRSLLEIERIEYLLKALKNYSLFESPVVQDIRIISFLNDFIALIGNDFKRLNIQVSMIADDEDIRVRADGRALHHVLLNVMTNAADALAGTDTPRIAVGCYRKGDMVVIKIDDNGKGIPESDREHLFKPFFTSKTAGTGLGLVIVRKMLTAMQGYITIDSYQGVGTTVAIVLPGALHGGDPEKSAHY